MEESQETSVTEVECGIWKKKKRSEKVGFYRREEGRPKIEKYRDQSAVYLNRSIQRHKATITVMVIMMDGD
jgi:hypothetical protein